MFIYSYHDFLTTVFSFLFFYIVSFRYLVKSIVVVAVVALICFFHFIHKNFHADVYEYVLTFLFGINKNSTCWMLQLFLVCVLFCWLLVVVAAVVSCCSYMVLNKQLLKLAREHLVRVLKVVAIIFIYFVTRSLRNEFI